VYYIPCFNGFDGLVVYTVNAIKAIKPIETWNILVIHTVIDSYIGFILPRTHDTHQWLLLQFVILLMMDADCVRNM